MTASKMCALPIFFTRRMAPLVLEPVHHRLDGGVGRPAFLGEGLLNLAHRGRAAAPQRVHDLEFQLAQLRQSHVVS